jgi:RNA recognition motif-containing protein
MSDSSRLKATIFVGALDMAVTSQTLHATFLPFGEIVDIQMPKPELPSSPDPHRGFGYVEFESAEDAREAIDNMNQSELFGRVIQVAQAKPIKDLSEGLGSKVAVWEQVHTTRDGMHWALTGCRRVGWQSMPSAKKTATQPHR